MQTNNMFESAALCCDLWCSIHTVYWSVWLNELLWCHSVPEEQSLFKNRWDHHVASVKSPESLMKIAKCPGFIQSFIPSYLESK